MKKLLVSIAILLVLVTGCAPGTDIEVNVPDTTLKPVGAKLTYKPTKLPA